MTLSLHEVEARTFLTSKVPGETKIGFEFGSAIIFLARSEASMISEHLRCSHTDMPPPKEQAIQGDQGWMLLFKYSPRGLHLEVNNGAVGNGRWKSGKIFLDRSTADKVADQMDGTLDDYDELNDVPFIADGALPAH